MHLPVSPPVAPMLAKSVKDIPAGMHYEPKWDGFRCIAFRDGAEVELGSRNERPLTRYFPEVVEAVRAELPERCVVDGEIVIAGQDGLDFEALLQRIHPATSRVNKLAAETPATFIAFDLLAIDDEALLDVPFRERRARLLTALDGAAATAGAAGAGTAGAGSGRSVHATPATDDIAVAREWFSVFEGAGLDGVVAKPFDVRYLPDQRAMFKIKHERTADCVVAGFRWHKNATAEQPLVGSLLLGLYGDGGRLHHVGVAASFPMARRRALVDELRPYLADDRDAHPWAAGFELAASPVGRLPGAVSRWNAGKDLTWEALRPELVAEVAYDHMQGDRFRHATQFRRWRPDRDPRSCTYAQLERPVHVDLGRVLAGE